MDIPKITEIFTSIVDEVLDHENKNYADIEYLGSGTFSEVLQIGDKVLKIGTKRNTYKIPYDKRILEPLIRVNLDKMNCVIEVTEKVDTNISLSREELYDFYKELRERKIICADLKEDNIGRLLKDNKKNWNKKIADDKTAVGFTDYYKDEILKKGELVLLDTDCLYKEDCKNITWGNLMSKAFEERYQQEKELSSMLEENINNKDIKVGKSL